MAGAMESHARKDLWDCHVHVFGPYNRYPLAPQRSYTPEQATLAQLQIHLDKLGLNRVVLVQPSPFAWDNSCLLAGLTELGSKARGVIAMRSDELAAAGLNKLWALGCRGLRMNPNGKLRELDQSTREELSALAALLQGTGWHLELNADLKTLGGILELFKKLPLPIVAGHLADLQPGQDLNHKALRPVYAALAEGRLWIKISGWDRYGAKAEPQAWAGLLPGLLAINDQAFVWGSDWPHTPLHNGVTDPDGQIKPFRQVDDMIALHWLRQNLPPETCQKIFTENPARLYG